MSKGKGNWSFRDVSLGLQKLREFLLGRKHTLHGRFPTMISPRTIPTPDIPRGPDEHYSNKYYFTRHARDSVLPPVIAPVAEGPPMCRDPFKKAKPGGVPPDSVCFNCAPTPGPTWWWDGHFYYETQPDCSPPEAKAKASPPCSSRCDPNPTEKKC
ncbi:hypothetical protein O3G_MSEX001876 [Manduca sexta]|uniref:NADH dehydrogenase [ubiquinone] 1 alpha subcomplex subunit 7 n=1 Tax=Manduca sexta TaxID=7130 RepID=A0A922CCY3_MANSE|nr:hypothetical protein O3G_MSEX001876 [Manduca sexta]KAG6441607.1 hypothetical protein O3G_MSEX001876 [Manduca sexta]